MSDQMTLEDILSAISSQGLAVGPTPCASPVGRKIGKSGRGAVPASPSAWQEKETARLTKGTYGPLFDPLSPSADLQCALESKLRKRLDAFGSPEYELTWKHWAMPSGPAILQRRALGRRTSDKECSGWPTPSACSPNSLHGQGQEPEKRIAQGHQVDLQDAARLASWPTASARDWKNGKASKATLERNARPLSEMAVNLVSGLTPSGTNASTEKQGALALNPRFSLWLQGYPDEWACCGDLAMRSTHRSPRSSSKRISK